MFEYNDQNIKGARTRDEMFREEQLIMTQKVLDKLTELVDLLSPKKKEAHIEKTVPEKVPGEITEMSIKQKKPRTKKEVK